MSSAPGETNSPLGDRQEGRIPFLVKHGNQSPHFELEEGEHVTLLKLGHETTVFLSSGDEYLRFPEFYKGCRVPFRISKRVWDFSRDLAPGKEASSLTLRRIYWFFKLQQEAWFLWVAMGTSGT